MANIRTFEESRRNVLSVITKWYASNENGEEYCQYRVGSNHVVRIDYHIPKGEGDQHYVDVYRDDGRILREFHPTTIEFGQDLRDA